MPFNENGLYVIEDIAFCNTVDFTKTGQYFKKHGVYTKAPEGSREHKQFWDIEEDRLKNGMTLPGKLKYVNGVPQMQEVYITGEYYGFLNYARILRTTDESKKELKNIVKDSTLLQHSKKVGKKDLDFPAFLDGQYHWFTAKEIARNLGLHVICAKSRRKGYSYMEGWDAAHTVNMNKNITVLIGAYDYKYITLGDQIIPMAKRYLDFLELHTDFARGYLKEQPEHIKLGFKKPTEGNKEFGYKSQIVGVSFMNNPDAAVGKDARKIKLEECGKFPNLKEALSVTMSTTEDGSFVTGQIVMFGTGGTDEANWRDFEEIYYNPKSYNCLSFDNVWDEGAKGNSVGWFHPQELGDPAFIDPHGNSLIEEAKQYNDKEKKKKKAEYSNTEYLKYIGQRARNPKEAFASGSDNIFPSAEILDQLNRVKHDKDFKYLAREGQIVRTEYGLKFEHNSTLKEKGITVHDAVKEFPLKDKVDVTGCYVEWVSPYRDKLTGKIPKGLYRVWHDPYAHDKDKKNISVKDSLGATYVYERVNNITPTKGDLLVACYVGRPERMDDYNETLLKICEYWNAELMFENDRGDVKRFFTVKQNLHLLADEPDLEWEVGLKSGVRRGKGMNMNEKRKAKGVIYLRDWLLEKRGKDVFGGDKLNLHYIYDVGLLEELLKWNVKGNFDRVSAMLIGMFDAKETFNKEIKLPQKVNKNSFFNRPLF